MAERYRPGLDTAGNLDGERMGGAGRTAVAAAMVMLAGATPPARAAVERVRILERAAFAPGVSFGEAGAYEKIRGIAYFALDPDASANARVVDLKHAPRDARGRVTFKS